MSQEIQVLHKQRSVLKGQLTRFKNFVDKVDRSNKSSINELKFRLDKFNTCLDDFNAVQEKIECLDTTDNSDEHEQERELFENSFYSVKTIACTIVDSFNAQDSSNIEIQNSSNHSVTSNILQSSDNAQYVVDDVVNNSANQANIKLPVISLPTFSGKDDEWVAFYDSFKSLIHDNKTLPDVQKLHYLKSSLTGEAAIVIQSISVTSDNYKIAWELLKENFENKPSIIDTHVKALFNQEIIIKESSLELRQLLNNTLKHLSALKALKQPTEYWDLLIVHLIASKFDIRSKREWEKLKSELTDLPTIEDLTSFLKKRCQYLQNTNLNVSNSSKRHSFSSRNEKSGIRSYITTKNLLCNFCHENHPIYRCKSFLDLNIQNRINEVSKRKLCKNCLKPNHQTSDCSSSKCRLCNLKHNTLLHLHVNTNTQNATNSPNTHTSVTSDQSNADPNLSVNTSVGLNCSYALKGQVLLPTALVHVYDRDGNKIKCRVLLDSASQSNFITKDLLDLLGVNSNRINVPILGINNSESCVSQETCIKIESLYNKFSSTISCLVLPRITQNLPQSTFNLNELNIPKNLYLADPDFNKSSEITLLLGAELFWKIICIDQVSLGKNLPVAQKTQFGWVISGPLLISKSQQTKHKSTCVSCLTISHNDINLQHQLTSFWKLEEINSPTLFTTEESQCEEYFVQTTRREQSGKFVVRLPFKENIKNLGESYDIARRRFFALENRFDSDETIKIPYVKFMQEYIDLGHMTQVSYDNNESHNAYYLPHHAVYKSDSLTSKVRVVFDGSCKSTSGISLNDTLMVGPTVQSDLFTIVLGFRLHEYAFTSDCEKMYRQVIVDEKDRIKQNILWRPNKTEPLKCYQLNTVTYGTSSAPFLATRCLLQISNENKDSYPVASNCIKNHFYIDDLISGSDTFENAREVIQQIDILLKSAGFSLRKWASNCPEILNNLDNTTTTMFFNDTNSTVKTLGLSWDSNLDVLKIPVNISNHVEVTKRTILSTISKIFDPLGLIGPIVITAKIIIQKLWQLNLNWDESIPIDLYTSWVKFRDELIHISEINIPRYVLCTQPTLVQLHAFSDACETSYGACVYLRSTDSSNCHTTRLFCAKSKVAPLKSLTIPKLELCAAHLASKLVKSIRTQLNTRIDEYYMWCDSTIVLAWLSRPPSQLKPFVANRVADIISSTDISQWHHVRSHHNPADIISRGVSPKNLYSCSLWWHGPAWLCKSSSTWPISNIKISEIHPPEIRTSKVSLISTTDITFINKLIDNISNLGKLQRIVSYCLRFTKNCTLPSDARTYGPITLLEIQNSMNYLIRAVQSLEFGDEINRLKNNQKISNRSTLLSLNPHLDQNKLLRVGGRLRNSNLSYNRKHPYILPRKSHLTKLIINDFHIKNMHIGAQATLGNIRNNGYWPIGGLNVIKGVLKNCVNCRRINPISYQYLMGDLPNSRITQSRPFSVCGTDFAGPFFVKETTGRGRKLVKSYLCVFVCFTTKAVHLETVGNLSTESFIACLRRFIARRGLCHTIYSDNGTNYVGANSEIKHWYNLASSSQHNDQVSNYLTSHAINWKFNPARSPHFGGLWESVVKSVKRRLHSVTHNINFTLEELNTLFVQIEAILNSRPLIPLTSNPTEFTFLSPGHFLIGDSLTALPEPNLLDVKSNRLSRFQMIQQIQQSFWKRWKDDYLTILQTRTKWKQHSAHIISRGTIVLLRDSTPPLHWRMGRVIEVHPAADGTIRVVSVKTSSGVVKRGVNQLCELLQDSTSD